MTIRKLEIERFSVTSSKPIEKVVAALKAAVGQPNMAEFAKATKAAQTFAELERTVQKVLGRTELMIFMELDLGGILRRETGRDVPKVVRGFGRHSVGAPLFSRAYLSEQRQATWALLPVFIVQQQCCQAALSRRRFSIFESSSRATARASGLS